MLQEIQPLVRGAVHEGVYRVAGSPTSPGVVPPQVRYSKNDLGGELRSVALSMSTKLRLEDRVARSALSQSEAASRADLAVGMSMHGEAIAKSNNGEELTQAEETALSFLVDSWFRRALVGAGSSRQIRGGDGSTSRVIFSALLFDNPGLRRIWESQRSREVELILLIDPGARFIDDFAEEIRTDLAILDERAE